MGPFERRLDGFLVSTDRALIDDDAVHRFLSEESYWARGIPREIVARSLDNSIAFGVYDGGVAQPDGRPAQIGLARVITDRATFAYLADVYILPAWRGRGLSKWLMGAVMEHPDLQGLRRWMLVTRDAHGLYRQHGFSGTAHAERIMERVNPDVYRAAGR